MKTLSEQVELLEVKNMQTIYQMKKWREHAESLELRLDNLIEERDETLVNRDIAEDLVDELRLKRKGLQIEVDNLAEENKNFAVCLEGLDYSPCEIDNIAGGWAIPESIDKMSTYHVGVDVTRSIYVYVDANNEEEAEKLALIEADSRSTVGAGAWVNSEVHFIDKEN
jgi:hypothetical protein